MSVNILELVFVENLHYSALILRKKKQQQPKYYHFQVYKKVLNLLTCRFDRN